MLVTLIDPLKIHVVGVATRPIKALDSVGGISRGLDHILVPPSVAFGMSVCERNGAGVAMEDGKWIDPTGGGLHINYPSAQVVAPRIGLLNKSHGLGMPQD